MVSLLCYSDETADGKRYAGTVLRSTSRWTKPDGKGSLKQIFHSLYLLPALYILEKAALFDSSIFPVLSNMIQMKKKKKQKNPTNSLKTESAPERPTFAGAFPID